MCSENLRGKKSSQKSQRSFHTTWKISLWKESENGQQIVFQNSNLIATHHSRVINLEIQKQAYHLIRGSQMILLLKYFCTRVAMGLMAYSPCMGPGLAQ